MFKFYYIAFVSDRLKYVIILILSELYQCFPCKKNTVECIFDYNFCKLLKICILIIFLLLSSNISAVTCMIKHYYLFLSSFSDQEADFHGKSHIMSIFELYLVHLNSSHHM